MAIIAEMSSIAEISKGLFFASVSIGSLRGDGDCIACSFGTIGLAKVTIFWTNLFAVLKLKKEETAQEGGGLSLLPRLGPHSWNKFGDARWSRMMHISCAAATTIQPLTRYLA